MSKRIRVLLTCTAVAILGALGARSFLLGFDPPDRRDRQAAVGATNRLPKVQQLAFDADSQFDPLPKPQASDWLAQHSETGQTFAQFARGNPNRPDQRRNTIYLQPVGDFPDTESPDLENLKDFAERFFAMPVLVNESIPLDDLTIQSRTRADGSTQILSTDVLAWLEPRVPEDAYCLLAVTMTDLYPQESWNFVFGQASLRLRVGVYSFARYAPSFHGEKNGPDTDGLVLLRSCKVLAHETGHMFGIKHCVHYHCLMNGSNHLAETDRQPIHLCPVCLRKLQSSVQFDIAKRYERLGEFAKRAGWTEEGEWISKRLSRIGGQGP